jgi:hypothetical protein
VELKFPEPSLVVAAARVVPAVSLRVMEPLVALWGPAYAAGVAPAAPIAVNEDWTELAVVSPVSKLPTIAALAAPWKSMTAQNPDDVSLILLKSLMGLIGNEIDIDPWLSFR